MIVLGLDASAGVVGVALAGPGGPRGDLLAPDDHRPAAGLLAAAAELLARSGLGREGVQGLAVAVGPGSYAGVRAAVVTAKAWAWAAGLPLAAVGSLEAIAWAAAVSGKPVAAAIDARRGRVYGALYVREEEQLVELEGPAVRERRTWLDELRARDVVLAGPGWRAEAADIGAGRWAAGPAAAAAGAVAAIGRARLARGEGVDPLGLVPAYVTAPDTGPPRGEGGEGPHAGTAEPAGRTPPAHTPTSRRE